MTDEDLTDEEYEGKYFDDAREQVGFETHMRCETCCWSVPVADEGYSYLVRCLHSPQPQFPMKFQFCSLWAWDEMKLRKWREESA